MDPKRGQVRWNGAGENHDSPLCLTGLTRRRQTASQIPSR